MEQLTLVTVEVDRWRDCPRCIMLGYPGRYPEQFFKLIRRGDAEYSASRSKLCDGCVWELDADKLLKQSIGRRIADHADRHGTPLPVYRTRYNMATAHVVAWFKTKWGSGTLDCGCATADMKHGYRDAELHQTNPAEPFFPTCWRLVCTGHHRSMQNSSEQDYAAKQRGWGLWREARDELGEAA